MMLRARARKSLPSPARRGGGQSSGSGRVARSLVWPVESESSQAPSAAIAHRWEGAPGRGPAVNRTQGHRLSSRRLGEMGHTTDPESRRPESWSGGRPFLDPFRSAPFVVLSTYRTHPQRPKGQSQHQRPYKSLRQRPHQRPQSTLGLCGDLFIALVGIVFSCSHFGSAV